MGSISKTSKGEPTNLYLSKELKKAAKKIARENGMSFSEMVERLLVAEMKRKRGFSLFTPRTMEEAAS